jgi:hypothetical protein
MFEIGPSYYNLTPALRPGAEERREERGEIGL